MLPVVVLAGGLATRMRPMTEKIPKAMLDVDGHPFIYHQLKLLKNKGVSRVILCAAYLGELIKDYVREGGEFGLDVTYSFDGDKLLGTGGAIKRALDKLPENFFVLYGDSYLDINYQKIEKVYLASGTPGLMTVFRNEGRWDASNVIFWNNELIKYSKKHKTTEMCYIDYGLGILKREVFDMFAKDTTFDLSDVYERLSDMKQLKGYEVFERFYEIGSPQGLEDLRIKLKADLSE